MILSPKLNEIYQQTKQISESESSEELHQLAAEIEAVGSLLAELDKTTLGGKRLTPAYVGPAPTHCKACGQKIPSGSAGGMVR